MMSCQPTNSFLLHMVLITITITITMSGVAVDNVGLIFSVKFGDSRSNELYFLTLRTSNGGANGRINAFRLMLCKCQPNETVLEM